MKAARFDFVRPGTLEEALALLGEPGSRPLSGGQSLGPMLNLRLARPSRLVGLAHLPELRWVEETPEGVLLSVRDTGHGIAREDLARVFDKFVQIKHSADTTPGSVGLGLAIAKEIVETYGGRIWVDSTPGVGSVFSFIIPLRRTETTATA